MSCTPCNNSNNTNNNSSSNSSNNVSAAFPNNNLPDANSIQICEAALQNDIFSVTSLAPAMRNFSALNTAVNMFTGYEVRWFRAIPEKQSADVILHEWTLYNVSDTPICIKAVVPDGSGLQDPVYQYDLFGLEYAIPFEIQIDINYWKAMTNNDGSRPQKNDIVYFPLSNKLFEVTSTYIFKGFLEQETTFKINLKKYEPKASRKESVSLSETIDKYTVSFEEVFGEKIESDINKIVNDKQFSPTNSTSKDKYKIIDKDLRIVTNLLDVKGVRVAESYYDLSTSTEATAVLYNKKDYFNNNTKKTYLSWFKYNNINSTEYEIESIKLYSDNKFTIKIKTNNKFALGSTIQVYRSETFSFYAKIIDTDTQKYNGFYLIEIDDSMLNYMNDIRLKWFNLSNFKLKQVSTLCLLNGDIDNNQKFYIGLLEKYIYINIDNKVYGFILDEKIDTLSWHSIVITFNDNKLKLALYSINNITNNNTNSKLNLIYKNELDLDIFNLELIQYSIIKSSSYITNIRLYSEYLEDNNYEIEMLRYFSKDGDQLILGDNAEMIFDNTYIGEQR